jgi:hypothetical protein
MNTENSALGTATNGIRTALGVSGILALVAAIIAIYAIIAGIVYAS